VYQREVRQNYLCLLILPLFKEKLHGHLQTRRLQQYLQRTKAEWRGNKLSGGEERCCTEKDIDRRSQIGRGRVVKEGGT